MTTVHKSALVSYSAGDMYRLVAAIESYPDFLPWCHAVTLHERTPDYVRATIDLSKGPVHKSFTTVNRMVDGQVIEMHLEKGPFQRLDGIWQFKPLGEAGCKVSLDMEFEFSSRLLAATVGPVFNDVANRLVDAFTERAVQVYGKQ